MVLQADQSDARLLCGQTSSRPICVALSEAATKEEFSRPNGLAMTCEARTRTPVCILVPMHRVREGEIRPRVSPGPSPVSLRRRIFDFGRADRRSAGRSPLDFRRRWVPRPRPTRFDLSDRTVWGLSPDSRDHEAGLADRARTVDCSTLQVRSAPEAGVGLAKRGDRRSNQRSL